MIKSCFENQDVGEIVAVKGLVEPKQENIPVSLRNDANKQHIVKRGPRAAKCEPVHLVYGGVEN